MFPGTTLPLAALLASLLAVFGPLFTAPSFRTFCGLACGFLSQAGKRSVCGMLPGRDCSRAWSHDRAHFFFARARWNADDLGLAVARLVRVISRLEDNPGASMVCSWSSASQSTRPPISGIHSWMP
jgi:hypothetical protein